MRTFTYGSRYPYRGSNEGPPKCESRWLTTTPPFSLTLCDGQEGTRMFLSAYRSLHTWRHRAHWVISARSVWTITIPIANTWKCHRTAV